MLHSKDTVLVHANVEITTDALKAMVENTKKLYGKDKDGVYRIDTASKVGEMISIFLSKNDFESFVKDFKNYKK